MASGWKQSGALILYRKQADLEERLEPDQPAIMTIEAPASGLNMD